MSPYRSKNNNAIHHLSKLIWIRKQTSKKGLVEAKSSAWGLFGWASNPRDVQDGSKSQQKTQDKFESSKQHRRKIIFIQQTTTSGQPYINNLYTGKTVIFVVRSHLGTSQVVYRIKRDNTFLIVVRSYLVSKGIHHKHYFSWIMLFKGFLNENERPFSFVGTFYHSHKNEEQDWKPFQSQDDAKD